MSAPVVELRSFGVSINDKKILRSLDLQIPSRGLTVLLGPSGTGKSTLLRTLAGLHLQNPSVRVWGEMRYQNRPLTEQSVHPALVLQKLAHAVATVLDSLLSNLPNRSALTRPEQLAILRQHCDGLGQSWIMDQLSTSVLQLSLYQQRVLSILRETLAQPALLMLDEPTAGLDEASAQQMCAFIRTLADLQPILKVSHHLAQCRKQADWVVLIASGQVQDCMSAEQFFTAASSESAKHYLRTGSCPEASLEDDADLELDTAADGQDQADTVTASLLRSSESALHKSSWHQSTRHAAAPFTVPVTCATADLPADLPIMSADIVAKPDAKNHFMGPRDFVWLISGCIAGTPWPGIVREVNDDLRYLQDVGISQLVSLTEAAFPTELAAQFGIQVLHFPIVDMCAPTVAQAHALCVRLDQSILAGQTVALHCKAGLGRTGTMLAAYLLWTRQGQVSATQAITQIRSLNVQMIQSEAQSAFIHDFADYLAMTRGIPVGVLVAVSPCSH